MRTQLASGFQQKMFCDQGCIKKYRYFHNKNTMPISLIAPHQVDGVEWLLNRERSTPSGGLLCDEMGLGKTIQMLETMVRNFKMHTLIVVPKSLVKQWKSEINKFVPSFTVCVYDGSNRKFSKCDVCICPYSVVVDLVSFTWDRIILDEGHEIRNPSSLVHKTCMSLKARTKWILTGTPVFNKMRDFVSLCTFVGIPKKNVQAYTDDTRKEFVLRRVKTDMVECSFSNVEIEMNDEEARLYETVYDQLKCGEFEILEGLLRCRQVCAWPQLYFDGMYKKYGGEKITWNYSSSKFDALMCMIHSHPREKTLVFTQFIGEATELKKRLQSKPVYILDGSTVDRESVIDQFRHAPMDAVFIIQIKTGGVGLNLQEATRVYITQPSWNPATELQAIARAHRTGQKHKVIVKKLVYVGVDDIDIEMTNLQTAKSLICSQVLCDETIKSQIPTVSVASNFEIKLGSNLRE